MVIIAVINAAVSARLAQRQKDAPIILATVTVAVVFLIDNAHKLAVPVGNLPLHSSILLLMILKTSIKDLLALNVIVITVA
jgi:hypothetical protein